ncbi:hypothetical protein NDU88_004368 [Pleurodeles waltl]|uniref:Uncharacterized protein n=1 Tax=Pleurodeles waltl TaxID=8319 RepID=A0AAV7SIR4_PLEWA|nr:hypothetical protein NDU88_004368 [Pleurodeles waltl]
MAGTGCLRTGAGTGKSQDSIIQDSQKLDAVLAAVERIGDSLERACTSLEAKIDKVESDLVLLHADHRKLADKTSELEAKVNELTPATDKLKTGMEDIQATVTELEHRVEDTEGRSRRNNIRVVNLPEGAKGRDPVAYSETWLRGLVPGGELTVPIEFRWRGTIPRALRFPATGDCEAALVFLSILSVIRYSRIKWFMLELLLHGFDLPPCSY